MHVLVASVSGEIYSGNAESLSVPSEMGDLTILPHHQALVSLLSPGEVVVTCGTEKTRVTIASGVLEVSDKGNVSVLAELAGVA